MILFLSLALSATPALADMGPGCGRSSGGIDYSDTGPWNDSPCDTGDTGEECEGTDELARRSDSQGLPAPVVGSLFASALILGISARRRFRS